MRQFELPRTGKCAGHSVRFSQRFLSDAAAAPDRLTERGLRHRSTLPKGHQALVIGVFRAFFDGLQAELYEPALPSA